MLNIEEVIKMTELVNYVAEETGLTKVDSKKAVEAMMNGIVKGLKDNGKVTLTGYLTFTAKHKAATTARNPRTGETVPVAARTAVTVKAGSKLKDALN